MEMRPRLLYPLLVVAAVSVTVFSLLGIAAMTGVMPLAHSESGSQSLSQQTNTHPASDQLMGDNDGSSVGAFRPADRQFGSSNHQLASQCSNCGVVESIDRVEKKGKGTGLGIIAGGVAGALLGNTLGQGHGRTAMTVLGGAGGAYAGNEIERSTRKTSSYRIRVRLDTGAIRIINQNHQPTVLPGDHVQIINGVVVSRARMS